MNHENQSFVIIFMVNRQCYTVPSPIQPVLTFPLTVVRHRLIMTILSPKMAVTEGVWYKDEGGQNNKIDIAVDLIGPHHGTDNVSTMPSHPSTEGVKVTGRKVPLKIHLAYGDGQIVLKQDILQVTLDTIQAQLQDKELNRLGSTLPNIMAIIDNSGRIIIKVRITDVSKNHKKKLFAIALQADTSTDPMLNDISPAMSAPLEVRSKRVKRARASANDSKTITNSDDMKTNNGALTSSSIHKSNSIEFLVDDNDGENDDDEDNRIERRAKIRKREGKMFNNMVNIIYY